MADQQPSVGRIVHYVSYGTPGGEYTSQCRAAIIAGIPQLSPGNEAQKAVEQWPDEVDLVVVNPTGFFFNRCPYEHPDNGPGGKARGGTWHWPERV